MANLDDLDRRDRQPVFNLPQVIVGSLAVLVGVHLVRLYLLSPDTDFEFVISFAFIPARVLAPTVVGADLPGGPAAAWWSFLTYAFFHADWTHLLFNCLWLAAFGSPLAWRFGATRFLIFSAVGAIGGALVHLACNMDAIQPMIGASAAISAHMAGASRFIFAAGGPLRGHSGPGAYSIPAAPLSVVMRDGRVLAFLGVWFGLNLLFGLWGEDLGLASGPVAWGAHIGGFVAGLLLFPLFDPVRGSSYSR